MTLDQVMKVMQQVGNHSSVTVEQVRMGSVEDTNSYLIILRTPHGTVLQVDDNNPYSEEVVSAHVKVAEAQRELEEAQRRQMEDNTAAPERPAEQPETTPANGPE